MRSLDLVQSLLSTRQSQTMHDPLAFHTYEQTRVVRYARRTFRYLITLQYSSPQVTQASQHLHQEPTIHNIPRIWLVLEPQYIPHQRMIQPGFTWQQNTSNGSTSQTRQSQTHMQSFHHTLTSILLIYPLWLELHRLH